MLLKTVQKGRFMLLNTVWQEDFVISLMDIRAPTWQRIC